MPLTDLISLENVDAALKVTSKKQIFQELAAKVATQLGLDQKVTLHSLYEREKLGSTGLGHGVAIPHIRVPEIQEPMALFFRLSEAVDYDANDAEPVDLIVLLLAPEGDGNTHLKALSQLARQLKNQAKLDQLRGADGTEALYTLLVDS